MDDTKSWIRKQYNIVHARTTKHGLNILSCFTKVRKIYFSSNKENARTVISFIKENSKKHTINCSDGRTPL